MKYRQLVNLAHILIVAPLLWALATNKFPEEYKKYILWLVVALVIFHFYKLYIQNNEYMESVKSNIHHIKIFDSYPGYDHAKLVIKKGDIVIWKNIGEIEHTVTDNNGQFNSGLLKPNGTYSVKFDYPGNYHYHCMYHDGWMKGEIIVESDMS